MEYDDGIRTPTYVTATPTSATVPRPAVTSQPGYGTGSPEGTSRTLLVTLGERRLATGRELDARRDDAG
jgi:hypothetical protein